MYPKFSNRWKRIAASLISIGLVVSLLSAQTYRVFAAPGDLDPTFGLSSTGINTSDIGTTTIDKAYAVALQTGGELVVAGISGTDLCVARYTSAGFLDGTFSTDGKERVGVGSLATAFSVAVQDTGEIVAAGASNNGLKDNFVLVRFTESGGLDTTFNATGIVTTTLSAGNDVARAIVLQPGGKILAAGSASGQFALLRYNPNGSLDTTFGGGDGIVLASVFGANDLGHAILRQTDGKIIVAGQTDNGFNDDFAILRFDDLGILDTSFGGGDGIVTTNFGVNTNDFALALALQEDGRIVAAGISTGANEDIALARYLSTGSLDTSFGVGGKVVTDIAGNTDEAHAVNVQANGKIVVAGFTYSLPNRFDYAALRYTAGGALDTGFGGGDGLVTTNLGPILSGTSTSHTQDQAFAAAIQSDNKIVLVGFTDYPLASGDDNFAVIRYQSPNTLPVVSGASAAAMEDTLYTFVQSDFNTHFSDVDGDSLVMVKITALPASGSLRYNALDATLNQEIAVSNLGNLSYTPVANFSGSISFAWNGSDGLDYAAVPAQMQVTVGGVNDAPSFVKGSNLAVNEDIGAASIGAWAGSVASGPADESGQVLTFTVTTDNDTLFAVLPVVDATNGSLTFTPAPNANGTALATIGLKDDGGTANGGVDTSATQTFLITVTPVNDAPAFTKGANQSVSEDVGAVSVPGWATNLSTGPSDESGQALTFNLASSQPGLFVAGPAVSALGELSYTPATNVNGSAAITVTLTDNGGMLNGGVSAAAPQSFQISINPVNDPPVFMPGANQVVVEDAGPQFLSAWATGISAGPSDEAGQTLGFAIINNNPGLFSVQPGLSASGALSYTPAPELFGSAQMTVTLQDNGGGANTSATHAFTILVNPVNDAPGFTPGANPTVDEDSGSQTVANWASGISAGPANENSQVLTFHTNTNNPGLFAVLPVLNPTTGSLTYTPAANINGSALITVTLSDDGGTANGGVDISPAHILTITVNSVNDAPTVSGIGKTGYANFTLYFSQADFSAAFSDVEGSGLARVRISWLPANGTLRLNGIAIGIGQEILFADLGRLTFTPNAGWRGATIFGWSGSDGNLFAVTTAEVIITIEPLPPLKTYIPFISG